MEVKKTTTDLLIEDIASKVEGYLKKEKANLGVNKITFCRRCGVTYTTLQNLIYKKQCLSIGTALRFLNAAGYKLVVCKIND